jgi:hypothetical protein
VGPLKQLVPPGIPLVLFARPNQLSHERSALALWRAVVEEERERAFIERTGVDPLAVEEVVFFEVPPSGYVLLARGPFAADAVVESAGKRIAVPDVSTDQPIVRREGLRGDGRYAYAALDTHAMLAAKDASPELVAQILARREDLKSPRVFDAPDARSLETDFASSPLVLFQLEPLTFEPGTPIGLLFSRQRALALSVRPTANTLAIVVDLRGDFPPGAEHNFRNLVRSMGQAPLGSALGLAHMAEIMGVRVDERGVLLTASMDVHELLAALKLLFVEEMRELFD